MTWYNVSMTQTALSQETEILARVIGPENPTFTEEAAKSILSLGFSSPDIERMNALAAKARQGVLTEEEKSLLDAYLFVGSVVDLMHSKSRLSLRKHAKNPHG